MLIHATSKYLIIPVVIFDISNMDGRIANAANAPTAIVIQIKLRDFVNGIQLFTTANIEVIIKRRYITV